MRESTLQFKARQLRSRRSGAARMHGFTVMELSITLLIAGLLLVVAVPSMKEMLAGNRLTTLTNKLVSSIHYARSEAVTRNGAVVICSTNATSTNWSDGWLVKSGNDCTSGDLLKAVQSTDAALAVTTGVSEIIFRGDGTASQANFALVNASFTRQVAVSRSGHISTKSVPNSSLIEPDDEP